MEQQLKGELVKDPYKTIHTIILVGTAPSTFFCFKPRWCFQIFFIFTPNLGEDSQILTNIFQMG